MTKYHHTEKFRKFKERLEKEENLKSRGFWWGDDGSLRLGRSNDMVQMMDDLGVRNTS